LNVFFQKFPVHRINRYKKGATKGPFTS